MSRVGGLVRGTGILAIAALTLSACGGTGFDQSSATKVIQSVDVNLDPAGAITEVASNAVYLDELSGKSNSSTDDYSVEEVVEDLPVRVSTQYTTADGSGSNLDDLEGHTGRVDIAVTVENLTLDSSEVTYDVAGESRQSSALVGTPLSVAGSVELDDTTASNVVVDVESDNTTNGVVSQTTDGNAVVQWGTVLAPPQSEATTTFRLVADVEDFSTPEFDLAVQAGFHTDMSFEGMLTSTFDNSASSDYAMQQKAIELVADINEVLTRAGTTITEIRQNLDHTTDTLGVDAAQQLRQNSDDMVAEMQRVGEQLTALESQVEGSMTGAETAMNSQLSQIVASMNGMMGNTEATPPKLVTGQGCAATVEDAESNGSLYSTFLILGAQLEGYAEANAACRDEIVAGIQDTLGPEVPDVETCDPSNGVSTSITCALFSAQNSVLKSLGDLVETGEQIIAELSTQDVSAADKHNKKIGESLDSVEENIDKIFNPEDEGTENEEPSDNGNDTTDDEDAESGDEDHQDEEPEEEPVTWKSLRKDVDSAREGLKDLTDQVKPHSTTALEAVENHAQNMREGFETIDSEAQEISKRHEDLAREVCDIELPDTTDSEDSLEDDDTPAEDELSQLDELSIQLTGVDCANNAVGEPGSSLAERVNDLVDDSYNDELESFVEEQEAHWAAALDELDTGSEESAIAQLNTSLDEVASDLDELEDLVDEEIENIQTDADDKVRQAEEDAAERVEDILEEAGEEDARIKELVGRIKSSTSDAQSDNAKVQRALEDLSVYEDKLPEDIRRAFQKVVDETAEELPERVDSQVRVVTDRINNAQDAVVNSYNTTISGLATTSDAVVNDTAKQLDEQKASLEEQQDATTEALNQSTTNVLESIHQSTTSSTRDLEGASAQLGASLTNVILDLGDPEIQGSGILGSMSASSAMSDTADYQLALASQRAAGYANVRSEDIAEIMLRQAQFSASLEAASSLQVFHLDVPSGAQTQTIYAFHLGGDNA